LDNPDLPLSPGNYLKSIFLNELIILFLKSLLPVMLLLVFDVPYYIINIYPPKPHQRRAGLA